MSIKYTSSSYWKLVFLGSIAGCALLEKRPCYQGPPVPEGFPNSTPDAQNENGKVRIVTASVQVPRVPNADDPANRDDATPTVASTITQLPSATTSSCPNFGQCNAYASSVSVYWWPSKEPDTSCLSTLPVLPERIPIPHGLNPIYPSIYAIFVSLATTDGCGQIRRSDRFTASFPPDQVSTITDSSGNVAANDFGNAPCGPPGWNPPGQPYQPWFRAPQALFEQFGESNGSYCVMPEMKDPSVTLRSISGPINPPVLPLNAKLRRHRGVETKVRAGTTVGVQSIYQGPTDRRHLPGHMTGAATAHGVPQPPAITPSP